MKSLIYLFALISLAFGLVIKVNEETFGCKLTEERDQCCWVNNNGCCAPSQINSICTMAITTCCKKRKCVNGKCTYEYSHVYGGVGTDVI